MKIPDWLKSNQRKLPFARSKRTEHRRRVLMGHLETLEDRRLLATWSGDIPNGTVWSNTEVQLVVGNARVPAGATLTVEPGAIVKFQAFAGTDASSNLLVLQRNGLILAKIGKSGILASLRD